MSVFGSLMRAGLQSDGKNVDIFGGQISAFNLSGILGRRYYVDPTNGSDTNNGKSPTKAFATLTAAYAACTSGNGDIIEVFAPGTTSAGCTTYLHAPLDWTKHGIKVFGHASPVSFSQRSRVTNEASHLDLAYLLDVQGSNNAFYNMAITNFGSNIAAVGGVKVTGERNYFYNCHMVGGGHATPGVVANSNSLELAGSENTFALCHFGTDSYSRVGSAACCEILLQGTGSNGARNRFFFCETLAQVTSGQTAYGAVRMGNGSGGGVCITRSVYFLECLFQVFMLGSVSAVTNVVTGLAPNNGYIIFDKCGRLGFANWDNVSGNDRVYLIGATDGATAGLATVAS